MLARLHASSRPPVSAPQDQEPVERTAEPPEFAPNNDRSDEETFEAPGAPPRVRRRAEERSAIRDAREQGLISPATAAAVDAALNTLAEAVQVRNGRTLEEVVTEVLRPMLKTWLDDNLPLIVERLVRAEIERMTRNR
jgi:cell pole-organizing protein PopZ